MTPPRPRLTRVVDLFAGPGGWTVAARRMRMREVGIEYDLHACATRAAAGHRTIRADVSAYPAERFRGWEGLIASPPCQAFSTAGKGHGREHVEQLVKAIERGVWTARPHPDPRVWLVLEVGRWISAVRPEWVACEQVPAVLPLWEAYARRLDARGWSTWAGLVHAEEHGVPQTRTRAVLIANRTREVGPPVRTHQRYRHGEPAAGHATLFGEVAPWVSMAEALGWDGGDRLGFPRLDDTGTSADGYRERDWRPADHPSFTLTEKGRSWVRRTSGVWVDRRTNSAGPGGTVVPTALRSADTPAPTLAQADKWVLRHGNQPNAAVRRADEPAATVMASWDNDSTKWVLRRHATTVCGDPRLSPPGRHDPTSSGSQHGPGTVTLTEAEGAILQGFPADYPWQGNKTQRWLQIGNAVPPPMAEAILRSATSYVETPFP